MRGRGRGFHASKRMDASRSRKRIESVHENVRYSTTCFVFSHIFIYIYIWKGRRNGDNYLLRLDSTFSCSRTGYSYSLKGYRASFYSSIRFLSKFESFISSTKYFGADEWKEKRGKFLRISFSDKKRSREDVTMGEIGGKIASSNCSDTIAKTEE